MYGIVLVFILIVMGGAIAYIGDKLGTKVGKRKMSIFGLRPKHTSIIVTIITGILITSLTLGVLALTSQNVRVALFGMEKLNQQIRETKENLEHITIALAQVNEEREQTQAQLEKVQQDYKTASGDLERSHAQIAELEQIKQSLEAAKAQLDQKVAGLTEQQAVLEGDVEHLSTLAYRLNKGLQFVREGEIVYQSGQVIGSAVVPYSADAEENGSLLKGILNNVNQKVLSQLGLNEKFEVLWVSQQAFDQAVAQLSEAKGEKVVRLSAAGNIVYGEPVRVQIEVHPNQLIYEQGQLVYATSISLSSAAEAERVVLDFLQKVNVEAIRQGVLPDPLRGTVGTMGGAQFYDIVNELEQLSGSVEISAYASAATHAAGPLRLNVRLQAR